MSMKGKQVTIDKFFNELPQKVLQNGLHVCCFSGCFDRHTYYDNMYVLKCFI